MLFIADDSSSRNAAESLYVAYSTVDKKSSNLLRRVDFACQTAAGPAGPVSVCWFLLSLK